MKALYVDLNRDHGSGVYRVVFNIFNPPSLEERLAIDERVLAYCEDVKFEASMMRIGKDHRWYVKKCGDNIFIEEEEFCRLKGATLAGREV